MTLAGQCPNPPQHSPTGPGLGKQNHVLQTVPLADPGTSRDVSSPGIIQGAPGPWDSASQRQQGTGLKVSITITLTKR